MPRSLEEVAKEALELNPRQRLALAHFLLEANDTPASDVEAAWEEEIDSRIRALDEGRAKLFSYEQVTTGLRCHLSKDKS